MKSPDRIHLLAHANPVAKDVARFEFAGLDSYLDFIREHLPAPLRLTAHRRVFEAVEDERRGGRTDDAARIADLQDALDDPATLAIVAAAGGGYFARLVPHLRCAALLHRRAPLWALGFSEMTTFVNLVASFRCGRGVYWLCPNYLGWKLRPARAARAAFGEFWSMLPGYFNGRPRRSETFAFEPIRGEVVAGRVESGRVRLIGGCLSVLVAMLAGEQARRLRPEGRWLALEDLKEEPYRLDRYLAALKLAGWFERVAGVLVGDFHIDKDDLRPAVVELLRYHLPREGNVPIVVTGSFGHHWPISPLPLNRPLAMTVRGRGATIEVV